jgi:uncharacterized protein YndB with AHSA1/START domain
MAIATKHIDVPPAGVFASLTEPRTYPSWLVGCKEIRAVDDGWPQPGARFHHRVGLIGPVSVADSTKVLEVESPSRLVLEVRARPLGRGQVTFTLRPDATGTELTLEEHPIGALAPLRPLLDPLTAARNAASLDNLAALVEGRDSAPKTVPPQASR